MNEENDNRLTSPNESVNSASCSSAAPFDYLKNISLNSTRAPLMDMIEQVQRENIQLTLEMMEVEMEYNRAMRSKEIETEKLKEFKQKIDKLRENDVTDTITNLKSRMEQVNATVIPAIETMQVKIQAQIDERTGKVYKLARDVEMTKLELYKHISNAPEKETLRLLNVEYVNNERILIGKRKKTAKWERKNGIMREKIQKLDARGNSLKKKVTVLKEMDAKDSEEIDLLNGDVEKHVEMLASMERERADADGKNAEAVLKIQENYESICKEVQSIQSINDDYRKELGEISAEKIVNDETYKQLTDEWIQINELFPSKNKQCFEILRETMLKHSQIIADMKTAQKQTLNEMEKKYKTVEDDCEKELNGKLIEIKPEIESQSKTTMEDELKRYERQISDEQNQLIDALKNREQHQVEMNLARINEINVENERKIDALIRELSGNAAKQDAELNETYAEHIEVYRREQTELAASKMKNSEQEFADNRMQLTEHFDDVLENMKETVRGLQAEQATVMEEIERKQVDIESVEKSCGDAVKTARDELDRAETMRDELLENVRVTEVNVKRLCEDGRKFVEDNCLEDVGDVSDQELTSLENELLNIRQQIEALKVENDNDEQYNMQFALTIQRWLDTANELQREHCEKTTELRKVAAEVNELKRYGQKQLKQFERQKLKRQKRRMKRFGDDDDDDSGPSSSQSSTSTIIISNN